MSETKLRSLIKTISYRLSGFVITFLIALFLTSNIKISLSFGILEIIFKLILYFIHERFWLKVNWGRVNDIANTR